MPQVKPVVWVGSAKSTYRLVVSIDPADAVYVLHVFQKRSHRGIAEEVLTRSSGNVFADLGLPNPGELAIKSTLLGAVQDGLVREHAASTHPQVSDEDLRALADGDHERWTIDGLVALLADLGLSVTVSVLDATGNPVAERSITTSPAHYDPAPGR